IEEETGITGQVLLHLATIDYWFAGHDRRVHKVVHHYLLEALGGELTIENDPDHEAEDVAWDSLGEVARQLDYPNARRVVGTARGCLAAARGGGWPIAASGGGRRPRGTSWRDARDGRAARAAADARSGTVPARGPRRGVRRGARHSTGLLLAWLVVAATVLTGWIPAHADDAPQPDDGPQAMDVQITDITPTVLRPGDDWVIRGTVTNTGTEELTDPVLRLRFQTYVPSTRGALAAWTVSGDSLVTTVLLAQQLGTDLRPGQQHSYEITLSPEESPFYAGAAWGPRGIAVEATSGQVQASQRTTVLWYPDEQQVSAPTELSVLVPLTATAQEWASAGTQGTSLAEAAAGRLGPVLQAADSPRVSWALDPALLETQPLGAEAASRALASEVEPDSAPTEQTTTSQPSSTATDPAAGTATGQGTGDQPGDDTDDQTAATDPTTPTAT